MDRKKTIALLEEYINNLDNISAAYIFGSVAKGMEGKNSDVDLALLFVKHMDAVERFDQKLQIGVDLREVLNKEVDVVDLLSADPFFIHKVMEEKILICERDINHRVEFEVQKRKEYFDRLRYHKVYQGCAIKRLEGLI